MTAIDATTIPAYPPIENHHGWTLQDWYTGPEKWCQCMGMAGADGKEIAIRSKDNIPVAYDLPAAMSAFYPDRKERLEVWRQITSVLGASYGPTGHDSLAAWNDLPGTTFESLLRVIRKANV